MKEPTERQLKVLSFINVFIQNNGYPPTIREVADCFSISVRGAYDHVSALKRKGLIKSEGKRSRTLGVVNPGKAQRYGDIVKVPILGWAAAGRPILAEENWDGFISVHSSLLKKNRQYFAVKVRGDSMKDAGILDKDTALIQKQNVAQNGDIALVVVEEAVTLKRFFLEKNTVRLQSENPVYRPIYSRDVKVLGKLACVIRKC